jgi:hypothetical protein
MITSVKTSLGCFAIAEVSIENAIGSDKDCTCLGYLDTNSVKL